MERKILFLCLSFIFFKTQAQESSENQLGTWYMYNGAHGLSEKIKVITSAHVRYFELASEYQQEIYRVGFNYAFTKNVNFTTGFVYSITDTSYKTIAPNLYEYRFYQDLNIQKYTNNIRFKHRVRLAQRFKRQNFNNETQHRIRYGLFLKYPLKKTLEIYAFNEVFLRFKSQIFGQNRIGTGILKRIDRNLKLRLGYFYNQFTNLGLHRLQVGIILNTNHL
jgi:hypothetical protein